MRMTGTTNGTMTPSWVSLVISILLILLACLPACASGHTNPVSGEEVSVGRHMTVTLPAGSSLKVSASPATVSVATSVTAPVKTPGGLEPSPLELLSTPMLLHSSGTLPRGRIMLSVVITPPTSPGSEPFLARYDPVTATWCPVVSHYDPITQTVSGEIAHFSVWAALCFATTGIKAVVKGTLQPLVGSIKINGTVPNCTTSSGVSAYIVPSNRTLQFCAEDAGAGHVLVKVASTLAFPIDINAPNGSAIELVPVTDKYGDINQALYGASKGKWTGKVIPAGSEADVTLAIAPGESARFNTDLDDEAYLTSIIYSGMQVLRLIDSRLASTAPRETTSQIAGGACASQIASLQQSVSLTASELRTLAQIGFECSEQRFNFVTSEITDAMLGIVASVFENVVPAAFLSVEAAVGWSTEGTYTLTATTTTAPSRTPTTTTVPVPTLTTKAPNPTPTTTTVPVPTPTTTPILLPVLYIPRASYRGIKPTQIGFSGDSSNDVTNITWSSWTGTSATGAGTWMFESCNPNCASGPTIDYPATIQLSDPVDGIFTVLTETTFGPYGGSETWTYPNNWDPDMDAFGGS
jgi:hypothetical protein